MIIIPTYNERKNIRMLVGRIRAVLAEIPILFIDDNSQDGTGQEIKNLQLTDPNIHLITRPGKAGFASAYLDAFKFVLKNLNPEFIVTMDADLSHPPEKLPELINIAKEGDVGIGSRYVKGGGVKNWKLRRIILSRLGNLYARVFTKLPVKDITGGFMAIPIGFIKPLDLNTIKSIGYAFLMELKVRLFSLGAKFVEIPIIFEERKEGESKIAGSIIAEGIRYPLNVFIKRQVEINYPAWLLFLISNVIYITTLPRTIFFGDSPEFMASAATLGVPHPSGYPAYVLLAKLFTFLPFGNLEFRVGLFSALTASLALVVFYFLFLKISNNYLAAFATGLILAFSNIFWSQAIMVKVYVPFLLVTLVILLLFAKFWETHKVGYLIFATFLLGLGAGIHLAIILFVPLWILVALVYLLKFPKFLSQRYSLRPLILCGMAFLLGLSVYLFLPIRTSMHGSYYDFSRIFHTSRPNASIEQFKNYVLRTDYADYNGKFIWKDKFIFFGAAFQYIWQQFFWLLLFLPLGLMTLWRNKKFLILTSGVFFLNILGIIFIRSAKFGYENDVFYSYYYLPAYAMVALWIGLGLTQTINWISAKTSVKARVFISALVLLLPVFLLVQNYKLNNLTHFTFVDTYSTEVLKSLPDNAVLLAHFTGANTDTVAFGLYYQQIVKHLKPDVKILTIYDIHPEIDPKIVAMVYGLEDSEKARYALVNSTLKLGEFKNRPIYTTFIPDSSKQPLWTSASNGLVYKFYQAPPKQPETMPHYQLNYQKDLLLSQSNMFGLDLLAQYFYTQAAFYASNKDLKLAEQNFISAIKYDYKPFGLDQKAFIEYRNRVFGKGVK
ncbi:MAG TPA: glycosyltransferase [Patescibacteria group bacterium]